MTTRRDPVQLSLPSLSKALPMLKPLLAGLCSTEDLSRALSQELMTLRQSQLAALQIQAILA